MDTVVTHTATGETGRIVESGFSPAGVPNYHVIVVSTGLPTWWYRSDVR